jgi:hypothetical protein
MWMLQSRRTSYDDSVKHAVRVAILVIHRFFLVHLMPTTIKIKS